MSGIWLPEAEHHDLTHIRGNGPFNGRFLGVVLHVNVDEHGTSDSFYSAGTSVNPYSVTPNFQVYASKAEGGIHQYLPLDWQPWTQMDGNFRYASIETAGMPDEPLTDYQVQACGLIVRAYRQHLGMVLTVANEPGQVGLGTHAMGGAAWGGHPCPGEIRANQRKAILAAARGETQTAWGMFMAQAQEWYGSKAEFEAAIGKALMAATVPLTGAAKPAKFGHLLNVWHKSLGFTGPKPAKRRK